MKKCNILFLGHGGGEPIDKNGCLRKDNHFDHHIFKDEYGKLVAWEDDYTCKCGCWDDGDYGSVCKTYWNVGKVI